MTDNTRAPLADSGSGAKRQKGRPATVLSEELLLRALEQGAEINSIAKANGCSRRTIQRRIAAARKVHGAAWGKPLTPPEPEPERLPPLDTSLADGPATVDESIALIRSTVRGERGGLQDALTAARIALANAALLQSHGTNQDARRDYTGLRDQLRDELDAATSPPELLPPKPALAPEASLADEDMDGAPDA